MNKLWIAAVAATAFLAGCASSPVTRQEVIERGWVNRSVLDKPEHHLFKTTYDTVRIGEDYVDMIARADSGVDVIVFFGTWCPDSRREVPRFLKVADMAHMLTDHIKLYGLDRSKKSADGLTDQYGVERVPTFIFLKGGDEIGRITEFPETTIEGDMLSILARAHPQ
jgi:thiol-disulfide isomerase/thioredoxin